MLAPRILIFGQPFNSFSGGGITLTNLFKSWPKDNIAVAYMGYGLYNVTNDVCNTYYQLGKDESKWIFPFSLFQRKFSSGIKSVDSQSELSIAYPQTGLRYKVVNRGFYPILRWLGFIHFVSKISLSEKFKSWLFEFQPEVLYLQVSTREGILFAIELIEYLKVPSVIHMMDDWPSTISNKGLFKRYWNNKIDYEFRCLLKVIDVHLSISDAMSDEYKNRYNIKFFAFHNPIEVDNWVPFRKINFIIDKKYITILYSGRLGGHGVAESLLEVASAIELMENSGNNIKLHIQTPFKQHSILNQLKKFKCVVTNPFLEYNQIPKVLSNADILLLAYDFSASGIDYLRFSMPTKASEYMISGTPVLVYASEETAVSKFFIQNDCGLCVTKQSSEEIIKSIIFLINNEDYRRRISMNAVRLAREKFDAKIVRREFQDLLINLNR